MNREYDQITTLGMRIGVAHYDMEAFIETVLRFSMASGR